MIINICTTHWRIHNMLEFRPQKPRQEPMFVSDDTTETTPIAV